jgi:hypothetical protein
MMPLNDAETCITSGEFSQTDSEKTQFNPRICQSVAIRWFLPDGQNIIHSRSEDNNAETQRETPTIRRFFMRTALVLASLLISQVAFAGESVRTVTNFTTIKAKGAFNMVVEVGKILLWWSKAVASSQTVSAPKSLAMNCAS